MMRRYENDDEKVMADKIGVFERTSRYQLHKPLDMLPRERPYQELHARVDSAIIEVVHMTISSSSDEELDLSISVQL